MRVPVKNQDTANQVYKLYNLAAASTILFFGCFCLLSSRRISHLPMYTISEQSEQYWGRCYVVPF
ncbi:hypothetical protein BS47DRAFT_461345 [Hydnum rufescens UP504]|uniref:Uncharacterized protein n=1 Tax=Hydnum rufescens UP504 TaxID=1448309 RepID=A0A9P6AHX5_9AGAM|nr:hypothetical protein BS47DRAFT_461345 [Hydnum rufescens UP504]